LKRDPPPEPLAPARPEQSIVKALGQSEHVNDLLNEAADDLSVVTDGLTLEVAAGGASAGVADALEKGMAVESKVQEVSDKLVAVNEALRHEVTERHALEDQLAVIADQGAADRHAPLHDALTGLPNRALFNDRLEHGLAPAVRHGWKMAVMFVDLDNFKVINDSYGHEAGDEVLRVTALRLQAHIRKDDTISRYGGDEFLYVVAEVRDQADALVVADKVLQLIQEPCELTVGGKTIHARIGASIGISMFPDSGATAEQLISSADAAMYEAKRSKAGIVFSG
jgi:diguanylate cyclase (GGDEF)-like protein